MYFETKECQITCKTIVTKYFNNLSSITWEIWFVIIGKFFVKHNWRIFQSNWSFCSWFGEVFVKVVHKNVPKRRLIMCKWWLRWVSRISSSRLYKNIHSNCWCSDFTVKHHWFIEISFDSLWVYFFCWFNRLHWRYFSFIELVLAQNPNNITSHMVLLSSYCLQYCGNSQAIMG